MKRFAKSVLAATARSLPWGAREALFDALCERMGHYNALQKLAPNCNVAGFIVDGRYGRIQGASSDNGVLPTYGAHGTWAQKTNDALCAFLAEGGTLIDVGANIGLTSIPAAQNPKVRVFAFEPEPGCYANLVANIAANCPHGNVETRRLAVYERETTLRFEISAELQGDNRIRGTDAPGPMHEEHRQVIEIQTVALDDLPHGGTPLAVKIDTQGAEPFVIGGGRKTLARAGLVCMEYWPYGMSRLNAESAIVLDFIRGFSSVALGKEESEQVTLPFDEVAKRLALLDRERPTDYVDLTLRR